jgi:hypothetical protein
VSSVTYDAGTDTYTITGLSQTNLDGLGFVQAASVLIDQDAVMSGTQITVTARTVESTNGATSTPVIETKTVSLTKVLATTGNDVFIWDGGSINGRLGDDTVALRHGENLTGAQLAASLTNIETIDLGVGGSNAITGLTSVQVAAMTDGRKSLTIRGTEDDSLSLSGDWTLNGDGTYSGAPGVTLRIDGDVTITTGVAPFMMSLEDPDEMETFGLAALDMPEASEETAPEPEPLTMADVLSAKAREEDLTQSLPEEKGGGEDMFRHDGETGQGLPNPASSLQDDLQHALFHEV